MLWEFMGIINLYFTNYFLKKFFFIIIFILFEILLKVQINFQIFYKRLLLIREYPKIGKLFFWRYYFFLSNIIPLILI